MQVDKTKKDIILFGAGNYGKNALNLIGRNKVAFFVDNNPRLSGQTIEGIEIKHPNDAVNLKQYDIVVTVSAKYFQEITDILKQYGIHHYYSIEQYLKKKKYGISDWEQHKNQYIGKRCFLLGTGPSLTIEDLNRLHERKEVCFGANKIFKIFNQTEWRPDIYCATDRRILSFYQDRIASLALPQMFIAYYFDQSLQAFADIMLKKDYVKLFTMKDSLNEESIEFSENPAEYLIEGRTVIYAMIQLAAYMGFNEIYLLGVDFNYNDKTGYDKNQNDHFCKNYIEEGERVLISPQEYCLKAFRKAKEYALQHGIKICNATRGGRLEVFERVNLDDII